MKKVCMISLGCSKNLVNSEKILAQYDRKTTEFVNEPEIADEIIVNTCSFIDSATEESVNMIHEMSKLGGKVLVAGCLAERFGDELLEELPEIDGIISTSNEQVTTNNYGRIASQFISIRKIKRKNFRRKFHNHYSLFIIHPSLFNRVLSTPPGTAYLKIAEGCNNRCSFCVIPKIKGNYISFPHKEIIAEAKSLAAQGVRELIIIAQDTTAYRDTLHDCGVVPPLSRGGGITEGDDGGVCNTYNLSHLLTDLSHINGIQWLRLHYCYPELVTDELIELIATNPKIVKYIDMPIQHCNDEILRKMGRKSRKAELLSLLETLRERVPSLAIRTSLMVGFPGETEEQFEELCEFVRRIKFERMGVFRFSPQDETAAAAMANQVPEDEKQRRFDALMQIQGEIAKDYSKSLLGRELEVIIQGTDADGNLIARTHADSLDIDCIVLLPGQTAPLGTITKAKIIDTHGYDLIAELI